MFKIDLDDSVLATSFTDLEKTQLPFAVVGALNDAAFDVQSKWKQEIGSVFDAPTSLTTNAVLYKKATKQTLAAEVFLRNEASGGTPPSRYLISEVQGGPRAEKPVEHLLRAAGILTAGEYLVPSKSYPLDQYGNVPGGVQNAIIADLQAHPVAEDRSSQASRGKRAKRNRKREATGVYFYERGDRGSLPRGIYERLNRGFVGPSRGGAAGVRLVFLITSSVPRYKIRFNARQFAQDAFNRSFPDRFRQRLAQAVATAKVK